MVWDTTSDTPSPATVGFNAGDGLVARSLPGSFSHGVLSLSCQGINGMGCFTNRVDLSAASVAEAAGSYRTASEP